MTSLPSSCYMPPPLLIESVVLKQYLNILHLTFETLAPIRNRTTPCHCLNRNPEFPVLSQYFALSEWLREGVGWKFSRTLNRSLHLHVQSPLCTNSLKK